MIAAVNTTDIALFAIFMTVTLLAFMAYFLYNLWLDGRFNSPSPYSKLPLRYATELSFWTSLKVLRFLYNLHQYDNRIFGMRRAALCRETGRLFPNAVTWYGKISLDWGFLNKRYPGRYVSWGSLSHEQREAVLNMHDSVEGFQMEFSSPLSQPKAVEAKYALATPGPLYVDLETKVLLGWKEVPDTEIEVLIVQKPAYNI